MKSSGLRITGVILIIFGVIGFLVFGTNFIGYVIKEKSPFEFSEINDIIARAGDKKTINLNVKNIKDNELNNCELTAKTFAEWIYIDKENLEILPNENVNFLININIPDATPVNNYIIELELACDEFSDFKEFNVGVVKGTKSIEIKEIRRDKNELNIVYSFDKTGFIGDSTYIEVIIKNPDGFEISRIMDSFSLKTETILRNVVIELPKNFGTYDLYFLHPSDPENFIKKSIVIGKPITGKVVFKIVEGKGIPYFIFLFVIMIGIYFIFRSHRKTMQEIHKKEHSV